MFCSYVSCAVMRFPLRPMCRCRCRCGKGDRQTERREAIRTKTRTQTESDAKETIMMNDDMAGGIFFAYPVVCGVVFGFQCSLTHSSSLAAGMQPDYRHPATPRHTTQPDRTHHTQRGREKERKRGDTHTRHLSACRVHTHSAFCANVESRFFSRSSPASRLIIILIIIESGWRPIGKKKTDDRTQV